MVWDSKTELQQLIWENQAVIDSEKSQIAELKEDLERLQRSRSDISNQIAMLENSYNDPWNMLVKLVGDGWKGSTRDEFEDVIYDVIGDTLGKINTDMSYSVYQMEWMMKIKLEKINDLDWDIACRKTKIDRYKKELSIKSWF